MIGMLLLCLVMQDFEYAPPETLVVPSQEQDFILVRRGDKMIKISDSLTIVRKKANWEVLVVTEQEGKSDTVSVPTSAILFYEQVTQRKQPISLPDSVELYIRRKAVRKGG